MMKNTGGCGCNRGNTNVSAPAGIQTAKGNTEQATQRIIDHKVTLLISAGTAMAGNCEACFRKLIPQLKEAGASDHEIRIAILVGQRVKEQPLSIMKAVADELTGTCLSNESASESCPADEMIKDMNYKVMMLIATGAAMGANCEFCLNKIVPDLIEAGVADADIQRAVEIGQFIKDHPARIMKEAADVLTGSRLTEGNAITDCSELVAEPKAGCCD